MSNTIDNAFRQEFQDGFIMDAQQKGSKLKGTGRLKMTMAEADHFNKVGATSANRNLARHSDTQYADTPHTRRRVTLSNIEWADLIDDFDEVQMLTSPESVYRQSGIYSVGRDLDDIIITALQGTATEVTAGGTPASPSTSTASIAHTIDEDFTDTDSDLIVEKVTEASRILMANEVSMGDPRYFLVDATALMNLLNETEIKSADFNTEKALAKGKIDSYQGFTFIQTELLKDNAAGYKNCIAYTKNSLGIALGKDMTTYIDVLPGKRHSTQVRAVMRAGAVRITEDGVIVVEAYRA